MSPWVEERALAFAIHVILRFSEDTSTGCLGAGKECVDLRDTKRDGVRPRALKCCRSGVGVSAGFGDDDGPVAVRELTPMVADAETFGERQGRGKPLDCCTHVGWYRTVITAVFGAARFFFSIESEVISRFPAGLMRHKSSDSENVRSCRQRLAGHFHLEAHQCIASVLVIHEDE